MTRLKAEANPRLPYQPGQRRPTVFALLAVGMLECSGAAAHAQSVHPISVSAVVGLANLEDERVETGQIIGVVARQRRQGWGVVAGAWSLSTEAEFLDYSIRPLMIGVVYNVSLKRFAISPSVMIGYAINSTALKPFPQQHVELTDSFVWQPAISVSWDASERIGLNTVAGYLVSHPKVDFGNVRGSPPSPLAVDALVWTFGIHVLL